MELTVPTTATTAAYKLEIPAIKYDPEIMALASKVANAPSSETVQKQASIQSPGGSGFINDLLSAAKSLITTIPFSFKVGEYTIKRPTPAVEEKVPAVKEKPFIEQYMPYILIGGAGIILLIALRR